MKIIFKFFFQKPVDFFQSYVIVSHMKTRFETIADRINDTTVDAVLSTEVKGKGFKTLLKNRAYNAKLELQSLIHSEIAPKVAATRAAWAN